LLGVAVGALPLNRFRLGSWGALALLAAYVIWLGLSATWGISGERTFADLGRVVTYLGIFALAISIRGPKGARRMVSAVGCGIVVIAIVALLSRLHPAWFPNARESSVYLGFDRDRLTYPLGYWNGLADLVAIGMPLILCLACTARRIVVQALAAAAFPLMALVVYFTISRAGTAAAVLGVVLFIAFAHDRVPKIATIIAAGAGAAILIAAATQRDALTAAHLGPLARDQGNEMLAITVVVCLGVGLLQAGLAMALRAGKRPAWSFPSRKASLSLVGAAIGVVVLGIAVLGASGRFSSAWHEFKASHPTQEGAGRLESFSSNGRWPFWKAAIDEFEAAPLVGKGSGSFEPWWTQHREENAGFVQDAHSLYLETLGELGIVGFLLIFGFLGWIVVVGLMRYAHASQSSRTQLGAALAGCGVFLFAVAFDWIWELAVIPIAFLLLASVLVSTGDRPRRAALAPPIRIIGVVLALIAVVAIAIPLSAATSLRESQADARVNDFGGALQSAGDARGSEPFAAGPRLQEALVLEQLGRLSLAESAARAAVEREPEEWRAWVVLSRLQARNGLVGPSIDSYRKARSLNPHSGLFRQ
jgi:hypothetical protein